MSIINICLASADKELSALCKPKNLDNDVVESALFKMKRLCSPDFIVIDDIGFIILTDRYYECPSVLNTKKACSIIEKTLSKEDTELVLPDIESYFGTKHIDITSELLLTLYGYKRYNKII
jgi:hypothetical protein